MKRLSFSVSALILALVLSATAFASRAEAAGSTSKEWRYNILATAATHTLNIALYYNSPLTASTCTVYTTTNELATSGNYTQGGQVLTSVTATTTGNSAILSAATVSWPAATFTTNGAMIYDASDSNRCIGMMAFTSTTKAAAKFTLTIPSPLITLSWLGGPEMAVCHRAAAERSPGEGLFYSAFRIRYSAFALKEV